MAPNQPLATDRFGNTFLHLHAETWPPSPEKHAIMRALLDAGARADAPNIVGRTPLHAAVWAGDAVAVDMLARRCNIWRAMDHEGVTALDLAREREDKDVVDTLENVVREHAVAAMLAVHARCGDYQCAKLVAKFAFPDIEIAI